MLPDVPFGGCVRRKGRGAQADVEASAFKRVFIHRFAISGDDHVIDPVGGEKLVERPVNQVLAVQQPKILVWDALASCACADMPDHHLLGPLICLWLV